MTIVLSKFLADASRTFEAEKDWIYGKQSVLVSFYIRRGVRGVKLKRIPYLILVEIYTQFIENHFDSNLK